MSEGRQSAVNVEAWFLGVALVLGVLVIVVLASFSYSQQVRLDEKIERAAKERVRLEYVFQYDLDLRGRRAELQRRLTEIETGQPAPALTLPATAASTRRPTVRPRTWNPLEREEAVNERYRLLDALEAEIATGLKTEKALPQLQREITELEERLRLAEAATAAPNAAR